MSNNENNNSMTPYLKAPEGIKSKLDALSPGTKDWLDETCHRFADGQGYTKNQLSIDECLAAGLIEKRRGRIEVGPEVMEMVYSESYLREARMNSPEKPEADEEQRAFEKWLSDTCPSGDAESIRLQWESVWNKPGGSETLKSGDICMRQFTVGDETFDVECRWDGFAEDWAITQAGHDTLSRKKIENLQRELAARDALIGEYEAVLRDIGEYTGVGPITTDWRGIVRTISRSANAVLRRADGKEGES